MKKILLTLSLICVMLVAIAQEPGHLFIEIKKAGLECPLKTGIVFTNYWTGYLREELKTLFGVENTDINLIKR